MHQGNQHRDIGQPIEPVERIETAVPEGEGTAAEGERGSRPAMASGAVGGDLLNVLRGFCMGAADTVPGVSGGTVALILGHYQRLVTAISHVDASVVKLTAERRCAEAAAHVDARFLFALALGIGTGVITLAGTMHWLLDHHLPETLAVFFGLVLASVWIVGGHIDRWTRGRVLLVVAGAAAAFALNWLPAAEGGELGLPRLFLSASVAICAMILPGISGAFVLLLLGAYRPVTGLVRRAAEGEVTIEAAWQLGVFATGCAFGLLAFSRLLRWLLEHQRGATMAALLGLMIGSIGRLWPLQMPPSTTAALETKSRQLVYVAPADWPGSLMALLALAVAAGALVLVVERVAHRAERQSDSARA